MINFRRLFASHSHKGDDRLAPFTGGGWQWQQQQRRVGPSERSGRPAWSPTAPASTGLRGTHGGRESRRHALPTLTTGCGDATLMQAPRNKDCLGNDIVLITNVTNQY